MGMRRKPIEIGKKYGQLTIIKELPDVKYKGSTGRSTRMVECQCVCGQKKAVPLSQLTGRRVSSCGCLKSSRMAHVMRQLGRKNRKYHPVIATAHKVFSSYRDGDLTFEQFYFLSQEPCFYCKRAKVACNNSTITKDGRHRGGSTDPETLELQKKGWFYYNGLDRLDSSKPHNWENVVACCLDCNRAKNVMSVEEFRRWVKLIYDNWLAPREKFLQANPDLKRELEQYGLDS